MNLKILQFLIFYVTKLGPEKCQNKFTRRLTILHIHTLFLGIITRFHNRKNQAESV